LGIIQKSGLIRLGDVLVSINDVSIIGTSFRRVMDLLKSLLEKDMLRNLTFCPSKEYYMGLTASSSTLFGTSPSAAVSKRGRYVFFSNISRFRDVSSSSDTSSTTKKSFIEYEITCYLLLRGAAATNAATATGDAFSDTKEIRWSVWKRFSEFKILDVALRKTYGWQMNAMTSGAEDKSSSPFPSSYPVSSFFLSNHNSFDFLEKRRIELDNYWQAVLQIDEMTDFTQRHRYSRDLANFLYVENFLPLSSKNVNPSEDTKLSTTLIEEEDKPDLLSSPSIKERRTRRSLGNQDSFQYFEDTRLSSSDINGSEISPRQNVPLKSPYQRRLPGMFQVDIMIPRCVEDDI